MEYSAHETFEMHAIVRGNVQGVGFRWITRHLALGLGIKGTVQNLPDGTVEIYAQGQRQHLEELLNRLKEETAPGQIAEASIEYFPIETPHDDFRII
ncbi:MAG: acylphosphatase [Chlamydiales bacterium]